jgi:two-component system chemotaxis response regulator CheY
MGRSLSSLRALVVDDDRVALSVVSSVIRSIGIGKTMHAVNGEEALNLYQSADPPIDFIVCDYEMPKMNGIDLLKTLRGAGHETPFLMLTAYTDSEGTAAAKQNGVSACITKPLAQAQIERKIRAVLKSLLA